MAKLGYQPNLPPTQQPTGYWGVVLGLGSYYTIFGVEIQYSTGSATANFNPLISLKDARDQTFIHHYNSLGASVYYRARLTQAGYNAGNWSPVISASSEMLYAKFYQPSFVSTTPNLDYIQTGSIFGKPRQDSLLEGVFVGTTYSETFTAQFPGTNWVCKQSGSAASGTTLIVTGSDTVGGEVFAGSGYQWWEAKYNIPFDPKVLYVMKVRVRQMAAPNSGSKFFYCGVAGIAADGTTYSNLTGANAFTSQHYVAANAVDLAVTGSWTEYIGYIQGWGATTGSVVGASNPNTPAKLSSGSRYIRPMFIANYPDGVGGQVQVDYIIYPAASVSGLGAAFTDVARRSDGLFQIDGVINSGIIQTDGAGNRFLVKGLVSGYCMHGVFQAFPTTFQQTPFVWLDGGLNNQPSAASWSIGYTGSKSVYDDLRALNVTPSGFVPYAVLKQKAAAFTARTANFNAVPTLTAPGNTSSAATLAQSASWDNSYTLRFRGDATIGSKFPGESVFASFYYSVDVKEVGSGVWTTAGSGVYNVAGDGGDTFQNDLQAIVNYSLPPNASGSQFRLRYTSKTFGGGSAQPSGDVTFTMNNGVNNNALAGVSWNTSATAAVTASKTPDSDDTATLKYFAAVIV